MTMSIQESAIRVQPRLPLPWPVRTALDKAHEAVDIKVLSSFDDAQPEQRSGLVVELIDLYLAEAARLILATREALDKNDELSIKRAVHSLKGSSGTLGILQMALICDELERTGLNHPFSGVSKLLSYMEYEFARVREVLLAEKRRRLA